MRSRPNGSGCLGGASGKQRPDIAIRRPVGLPAVIETGFTPARNVEQEAIDRLGETVDGQPVEGALAAGILGLPIGRQAAQGEAISNARFEFCLYSPGAEAVAGCPRKGLVPGSVEQPGRDGGKRSPVGDPPDESGGPAAGANSDGAAMLQWHLTLRLDIFATWPASCMRRTAFSLRATSVLEGSPAQQILLRVILSNPRRRARP